MHSTKSLTLCLLLTAALARAQPVPTLEENIPFLVTFGNQAGTEQGDDDHCQVFFLSIPPEIKIPFYIRVFDPDCGGKYDEDHGGFNTKTRFSVYGGQQCISHMDARQVNPDGNYRSGNMLASKVFGEDESYDDRWYTFGPFNPVQGELAPIWGGYIFKIICEGLEGDDGNLYRYFLSTDRSQNRQMEGGNAFTFEYTFRLPSDPTETAHIFPFVDEGVVSIMQSNFDWDDDGFIQVHSSATAGENLLVSGDNSWSQSVYKIKDRERGKSIDIQFILNRNKHPACNNVTFYVTNQYGQHLPFYTAPISGIPLYYGKAMFNALHH